MEEVCTKLANSTRVAAIRIPPSEPHFFHPILPGFQQQLFIPISFFKYLDGQKCENAKLRSGRGKHWPVKINGQRLEDGWTDFAQDHDLHVGDFLVFRHEGDMVFDVMVFDPSFCEREYITEVVPKEEKESSMAEYPKEFNGSEEILKNKQAMTRPHTLCPLNHPYFVSTVNPDNLKRSRLHIPVDFARSNGLTNRSCEMILKDQKQRSWRVNLRQGSRGNVYIGCGWRHFRIANGLKEGDTFMFELIAKGKKPILSSMNIPKNFARSNGLSNKCCEMTLRDQKGGLWLISPMQKK